MYERYWKLGKKPFENDLDISSLFYGEEHREALMRLLYTVNEGRSLMLLTGESGCGKTYLCQAIRHELEENAYVVAMVTNPTGEPLELLRQIALELGIAPVPTSKTEVLAHVRGALTDIAASGSRAVIMIDNAETIDGPQVLEEIRLLLDLEAGGQPIVTVILIGQPRLRGLLKRVPALAQRVSLQFHLPALSLDESAAYINHRLEQASGNSKIFATRALHEIHRATRGVPRLINNLCDLSLLLGFSQRNGQIDDLTVSQAKEEFRELGVS